MSWQLVAIVLGVLGLLVGASLMNAYLAVLKLRAENVGRSITAYQPRSLVEMLAGNQPEEKA